MSAITATTPTTERDRTFRLASQFRRKLYTVQDILSPTPPPGRRPMSLKSVTDCNEVFPGIVLGNGATARNIALLKSLGVTHVLNCAHGQSSSTHVDTSEALYQPHGITFKGLPLDDSLTENISRCFDEAVLFIDGALHPQPPSTEQSPPPGKVFVHCREGVSRSATIVVAYLMIRWKLDVDAALKTVLSVRWICPNSNFQRQLVQLECRLKEEDGRGS